MKRIRLSALSAFIVVALVFACAPSPCKAFAQGYMGGQSASAAVSAPTFPHVKRVSSTSLNLNWKKAAGASGYEVYRYDGKKHKYAKVKTIKNAAAVKWTDRKLKTGKKYTYKIRAYRSVGGKKQYSAFTYTVSAVPYAKKARVVNAGGIWCDIGKKETAEVAIGEKIKVMCRPTPSKYGTAKNKKVIDKKIRFKIYEGKLATVNARGIVTGKAEGTTNIYLIAHNGARKKVGLRIFTYARPDYWVNVDALDQTASDALKKYEKEITDIAAWFNVHRPKAVDYYTVDNGGIFHYENGNNDISGIESIMKKFLIEVPCASISVGTKGISFSFSQNRIISYINFDFDEDFDPSPDSRFVKLAERWYYYYISKV